jgi:hypothetical protein
MNYIVIGRTRGKPDVELCRTQFDEVVRIVIPALINEYIGGDVYDQIALQREGTAAELAQLTQQPGEFSIDYPFL